MMPPLGNTGSEVSLGYAYARTPDPPRGAGIAFGKAVDKYHLAGLIFVVWIRYIKTGLPYSLDGITRRNHPLSARQPRQP